MPIAKVSLAKSFPFFSNGQWITLSAVWSSAHNLVYNSVLHSVLHPVSTISPVTSSISPSITLMKWLHREKFLKFCLCFPNFRPRTHLCKRFAMQIPRQGVFCSFSGCTHTHTHTQFTNSNCQRKIEKLSRSHCSNSNDDENKERFIGFLKFRHTVKRFVCALKSSLF